MNIYSPAVALMLMSMLIGRLRETTARLAELAEGISDDAPVYFDRRKPIVEEGQVDLRMYAVIEGTVAVSIGGSAFQMLVKTSPKFAGSLLGSLAERLRLLTARLK